MRANIILLGIEDSVKPILSTKVVNMFLVITIHQTNYPLKGSWGQNVRTCPAERTKIPKNQHTKYAQICLFF